MTKKEIRKFLDNTKVYVNGKSAEIQKKLFSFGYKWKISNSTEVSNIERPFLYMGEDGYITYSSDMSCFKGYKYREVYVDEILAIEITEPSYRPFKTKDECWSEMQKHQPFGWIYHQFHNCYAPIRTNIGDNTEFESFFNLYTFADGTPFGILTD